MFNCDRELCIASVFGLALMGAAGAADLAVKGPIFAPPPVFSWTGIYIGVGGGIGWGTKDYSWDQDLTYATILNLGAPLPPAVLGSTNGSHSISGGFFGGQLGANWQAGWAVFGIQGDAHWADIDGRGDCFSAGALFPLAFSCYDKVKSFGSVTGRVGAAIDRALIYAKGGWAWENAERTVTPSGIDAFVQALGGPAGSTLTAANSSQSRSGWTFGAGVEYAFAPNWSAFVEYNHFDFGTSGSNTAHVLSVPVAPPITANVPVSTTVTERFDVVKAGLNYKFNWWSAPVVGRY
jgi:outer membrane immunogenic protein